MADIADPEEKRALVSLKDRSRVVNFRGGLDKLLSAIRVCFADILGSHTQTDILLQVLEHFYYINRSLAILFIKELAVDSRAKISQHT